VEFEGVAARSFDARPLWARQQTLVGASPIEDEDFVKPAFGRDLRRNNLPAQPLIFIDEIHAATLG
jgi:hypothetical protein